MLVTARGALTASANILGEFTIAGAEVGGGGSLVADNNKIAKCAVGVLIADGAEIAEIAEIAESEVRAQ